MFKFTTAIVFVVTPVVALVLGLTVGALPAILTVLGLPVLSLGVLVARLALTRSGRETAANLQTRSEGLRESLR